MSSSGSRTQSRRTQVRLLFVCLGNICRSPTGEGVMRALVAAEGLDRVEVASAGTSAYHVGEPPDPRSTQAAADRGIVLDGAAAQVGVGDFARFDLLLAMDTANLRALLALAPDGDAAAKVHLLREFDPTAVAGDLEVPDPYSGGAQGFEDVLDMVDRACRGLLAELR